MTAYFILLGVLATMLVVVTCWLAIRLRTDVLRKELAQAAASNQQMASRLQAASVDAQKLANTAIAAVLASTKDGKVTVPRAVTNRVADYQLDVAPGKAKGSTIIGATKRSKPNA